MNTPHTILPTLPSYFGGKGSEGTYQTIINEIPLHTDFVSGFLGACSISRYIRPAERTIGIEPNIDTLEHWHNRRCELIEFNLQLIEGKFLEVLPCLDLSSSTYLYLDPPYPLTSRKQMKFRYDYEMDDLDHRELLHYIKKLPFHIGISTYPNRMYARELSDWRMIEFESMTRQGMATEWFFMNYPKPEVLHDYSFYGSNCRKRQDFKRRSNSLLNKFAAMPTQERNYFIQSLILQYGLPEVAAYLPLVGLEE